jgi:hypothetical protein
VFIHCSSLVTLAQSYGDPRNDVASNDVASQLVVRGMVVNLTPPKTSSRVVKIRLGNFNVGIMQNQFETDRALRKVMHNLNRVIHKCVIVGELDMMTMCEVGGHLKGMPAAGISAETHLPVLRQGSIAYSNLQNYMSCWNFNADASQLGLQQLRPPKLHKLTSVRCDPQLIVEVFSQSEHIRGSTVTAKLVQGNLHIRVPNGSPSPIILTRKRIVGQALRILEAEAKLEKERANDDASQPVVCVLLGDTNLSKSEGQEAVQPLQPVLDVKWDYS